MVRNREANFKKRELRALQLNKRALSFVLLSLITERGSKEVHWWKVLGLRYDICCTERIKQLSLSMAYKQQQ